MSKKILVSGGAGFIGSNLCEYLLEKGHEVYCVDNFYTGSKRNIEHLIKNKNFRLIEHDINTPLSMNESLDQIYHLACPASPVHYGSDPIYTLKTCFLGTLNMLELARRKDAVFFQASTSEVYGDPLEHPQKECYFGNVNFIGKRACYDEGKRIGETLCFDFHRFYGLEIRVARIFNTYGERMAINDGRVVSNFIVQALKGEEITVYGNGSQTRSFCYISDMIEGIYRLMNSDFTGPVNLGNPDEFTILEIARKVIELTKSNSCITFKPLPQDDPKQRRPDINLAKEKLKWQPKVKLEDGLRKTIEYFRMELSRENANQ
jgi:UDP-glucuronate decarboxylase